MSTPPLSRLLPELRDRYDDIPAPADVPPEQQQRYLFKSVFEFLARAAAVRPLVMLLDDLQWADESSLLLLEFLASRLRDLPLAMIGTYRDVASEMDPAFEKTLATLTRQRLAERVAVKPFDAAAVDALLAALGRPDPPQGLVAAIHRDTSGNVFFVEEVFRHLDEEGALFDEDGQWRPDVDVERLDVPEGVRLVTNRRLERLEPQTLEVLSLAAAMGLRFRLPLLEASGPDPEAVLDALEKAEAAQLVKPLEHGRELRYEFVHALARQTLLSRISAPRQQRLHLRIAEAIESGGQGRPDSRAAELAHHLVHAGASADRSTTAHWLRIAGENAFAAAAMDEAVRYFDAALERVEDDDGETADLLHRRGSARLSLGHREQFVTDLTQAFKAYDGTGRVEEAAAVVAELSYMLIWNGRPDEAKERIHQALESVGDEQSPARCRLLTAQGLARGMASEPVEAERAHEAAVTMARALEVPAILAEALQNQAIDGWFRLDGVGMARAAHEAAALLRPLNREWNLAHCLWMEQAGLVWQGRYDDAERINDELHPPAERHEDVGSLAISAMMNCLIEQARGNLKESSRHMRRSVDLFNAGGFPWGWISEGHYSVNALLVGDDELARTAFELAGANALPGLVWTGADTCYWLSGKARLGDPDTYELYESLRERIPRQGEAKPSGAILFLMGSIEALVLIGRDDEAGKLYPAMNDVVSSGRAVQGFTYGLLERFAGTAAAAAGHWDAAEGHFERALELAETLPHRVDQARVRYWYARMLRARDLPGDRERAETMLAEARSLGEAMGLHGLIR